MRLERRISQCTKIIPGGQLLGPTYDYTHRLLDFTLLANGEAPSVQQADGEAEPTPHVFSLLTQQGLAKTEEDRGTPPDDITRTPPVYPCSRSSRLQQLMRGDEATCWRWPIRPSAAMAATIRLPARSAAATCRWKSSRKSWALASILASCC